MVKFGKENSNDIEYYKGVFIDLGCSAAYATHLAMGHLGKTALTKLDTYMKKFMLQGYSYSTATLMAEDELGWK